MYSSILYGCSLRLFLNTFFEYFLVHVFDQIFLTRFCSTGLKRTSICDILKYVLKLQAGPSQVEAFENEKGRMHSLRLFCSFSICLMNSVMVVVHQNGASE